MVMPRKVHLDLLLNLAFPLDYSESTFPHWLSSVLRKSCVLCCIGALCSAWGHVWKDESGGAFVQQEGDMWGVGQSWGTVVGMNRLIVKADLILTLIESCTVYCLYVCSYGFSCTCVCVWAPILNNTSPHFTGIFFETVAIMSLFQECVKLTQHQVRLVYCPKCTVVAICLEIKAP